MKSSDSPVDAEVSSEVLFEVRDGVGMVTLARPRAINALTHAMITAIERQLVEWAGDAEVRSVLLTGEGERGFCSGADVRSIRQLVLDDPDRAVAFFTDEYRTDELIGRYAKPVTARLHGISMGGGLGLALHASEVVAAADLVLAMPETTIGLFPDVGVNRQLAAAPGEAGCYLAMTGASIDARSALWAGLVDRIEGEPAGAPGAREDGGPSQLELDSGWIDACFTGDDPVAIVHRLEQHDEPRARETGALIRTRSPLSVAVALEALRRAAQMDGLGEVLAQDLVLARAFVAGSDFVEGVRAQLVDKDRNPHWGCARLEDLDRGRVLAMFQS